MGFKRQRVELVQSDARETDAPDPTADLSLNYELRLVFHNFNLRIFNLRTSNPNKLIVYVFSTRCRISMCLSLGSKQQ